MLRTLAATTLAVLAPATLSTAATHSTPRAGHHPYPHHPECWRPACAAAADAEYNRHRAKARRRREAREAREARKAAASMSALEACIIRNESGGDPNAVNGQYKGIGQWSPWSWSHYSHGKYGPSPLDATYAEQEKVLRGEGEAGMIEQQGQYDGCA